MNVDLSSLYDRAASLGEHGACHPRQNTKILKRAVKYSQIDHTNFLANLAQQGVPDIEDDINRTIEKMSNILHKSASNSRTVILRDNPGDPRLSSWEQLLEE